MEDRIVLITPNLYQRIYSSGTSLVTNYSAEYLHTVPIMDNSNVYELAMSDGFYARLNEQLLPSCYGFSTFGVILGSVGTPTVRIGVINLEGVTLAPVTDRQILAALGVTSVEENSAPVVEPVSIPVTPVEVVKEVPKKSLRKELIECVETVYGDNYDWSVSNKLIIHWPEFEITNSKKHKHTIRDLFVKVFIIWSSDGKKARLSQVPNGKRLTLTQAEVNVGYRHSHMSSGTTSEWGHFCVGSGPVPDMIAQLLEDINPENFFLFLVLLDQYVRWESLEGGPYIRMASISTSSGSSGSFNPITSPAEVKSVVEFMLRSHSDTLSTFIRTSRRSDGGYRLEIRPSAAFEHFIQETWSGNRYSYDVCNGCYVNDPGASLRSESHFSSSTFKFKDKTLRYTIYNPNANRDQATYIRKPPVDAGQQVIQYLTTILNLNWPQFVKDHYRKTHNLTAVGIRQSEEAIPF